MQDRFEESSFVFPGVLWVAECRAVADILVDLGRGRGHHRQSSTVPDFVPETDNRLPLGQRQQLLDVPLGRAGPTWNREQESASVRGEGRVHKVCLEDLTGRRAKEDLSRREGGGG